MWMLLLPLVANGFVLVQNHATPPTRRINPPIPSSALSTAVSEEIETISSFTTRPVPVFIEDTDAYGVMYNSNYLRAFDRALQSVAASNQQQQEEPNGTSPSLSSVLSHEDVTIVSVESQKFRASPPLGGSFVVEGVLRERNANEEIWDLTMKSDNSDDDDTDPVIYNILQGATIVPSHTLPDRFVRDPLAPPATATTGETVTDVFDTYRDDFPLSMSTYMPLYKMLNLFERSRSNWLGGPEILHRLQQEGILCVVSGLSDLTLLSSLDPVSSVLRPVRVESEVEIKRRGSVFDFYQTAYDIHDTPIAQGKVTIWIISEANKRPTTFPDWFLESRSW